MVANSFDAEQRERELKAESAAWDTSTPVPARDGDIPTIDVEPYFARPTPDEEQRIAAQLRDASQDVGFYQLVGHGITIEQEQEILAETRGFHSLPIETKTTVQMDRPDWPVGGVGYLPMGERKLPRRDKGNLNEAFLIKSDRELGFDDNQWLHEKQLPGFRKGVERYAGAITDLALRLLPIYAVALDLEPNFFGPAFTHPFWRLRLTHYPPHAPAERSDAFGIAPHVDTTFFTLLLQDGPGLTIFSHTRQQWLSVPVVPGALVVNTGELLRQWSNDRFLSTRHFANNAANADRYSVPFFFNANADYPMECLPSCQSPDNPPRYPTISYLESQAVVQGE